VRFFRLEDASRSTVEQAFSGLGGLYASGRWHSQGRRIVYLSESIALASLEKLVHAHSLRTLTGLNYFEITIPDELIEHAQRYPAGWNADPATPETRAYGDRWLKEVRSAALLVPSAIIPREGNCLLNPAHPAVDLRSVRGPTPFEYDPRIKAAYEVTLTNERST
jgi:RES domain-containing protein